MGNRRDGAYWESTHNIQRQMKGKQKRRQWQKQKERRERTTRFDEGDRRGKEGGDEYRQCEWQGHMQCDKTNWGERELGEDTPSNSRTYCGNPARFNHSHASIASCSGNDWLDQQSVFEKDK